MKKILICISLSLLFSVSGCQKTPKEAIVADKSQGLPQESILEEDSDTPKDLGVPVEWKEEVKKRDGMITIEADCQIRLPQIYNTPVSSFEMKNLSEDTLQELCSYFSGGAPMYRNPVMTKKELDIRMQKMERGEGIWSGYEVDGMLAVLDELRAEAPGKAVKNYVEEATFAKPYETEWEKVRKESGRPVIKYSDYYYDTQENIGFTARIEKGEGADPLIRVMNRDPEIGSTTNFLYTQGSYVDEKELKYDLSTQQLEETKEAYTEYLKWLQKSMEEADWEAYRQEEALAECERILEELSLDGFAVTECMRVIGNRQYESWMGLDQEEGITDWGYSIYLLRKSGSLTGFKQPFQKPYDNLPQVIYAPSFDAEQIHMILTGEGIQKFEWTNLSEEKEQIAPNTKILSFDAIKEKLWEHILYRTVADPGENEDFTYKYHVNDVQLRAATVPAYENPKGVWMVPVWVFMVSREITYSAAETYTYPDIPIVLNAIDGGYIKPSIDRRIQGP